MENETEATVETAEPTEIESMIAFLIYQVDALNNFYFDVTYSEDWKAWTLEEQLLFRAAVEALFGAGTVHKEKFDSTVWKGHSDGTVNTLITSIRKQREGDTPGKKAEPVTAASVLAKRLKK